MSNVSWGVTGLTVQHGQHVALDNVTLSVRAGGITAVYGGDGAGKSTLLRALAGGVRPSSGSIDRPNRALIGVVPGTSGIYTDLSVDENIAFVAEAYGLTGAKLTAQTQALLARTGLEGTGDRLAGRLSGGMRQKLAFALAMLHEPRLLILDEPTTGVDPVSRADLWRLIAGAAADGTAVVVATDSYDEAARAENVLTLEGGHVVASGALPAAPPRARNTAQTEPQVVDGTDPSATPLALSRHVAKVFGHMSAVIDVDLTVAPGEVVGLLGANGAGKTTLIRMLLGLLEPSSGQVELFGQGPSRATRRRLGYVPQGLGLWEDLTVAENLAFVARAFGAGQPALGADDAELVAHSDTLVRDLPFGLRRRLAFAAALAHNPELLVLDEPTSGVGASARARLWTTIHSAAQRGAGVLVTTHHLEEADECDRLVIMAAGRVAADGRLADIVGTAQALAIESEHWEVAFAALEADGLPTALVGRVLRVPESNPERVRRALQARGLTATITPVPATLEEVFVTLTRGHSDTNAA